MRVEGVGVVYPEIMLPRLRYVYCPMCRTPLAPQVEDGLTRAACPACGWIHYPTSSLGVNVVLRVDEGIVVILPPHEPAEAPAALPGGHVEYGEAPEAAAAREAEEETGLVAEVVRCLGWYFEPHQGYPGPMVHFMFEARAVGGELRGSVEGPAQVFPLEAFPDIISPRRIGSRRAIQAYLKHVRL